MNEQKNNGRGIFYGVIGVATLVVAIIGATFAYFTATASNNAITGNMATVSLGLSVEKVTQADVEKGGMIPMSNNMVEAAVTNASNKGICVDDNGNAVCQIYKIILTNSSSAGQFVDGYVALRGGSGEPTDYNYTGTTYPDAAWAEQSYGTTMRWAQVFATDVLTGDTNSNGKCDVDNPDTDDTNEAETDCEVTGTTYSTGGTQYLLNSDQSAVAIDDIDAPNAVDTDGFNTANILSSGVTGSTTISGNDYDTIVKNYIRVSDHTWAGEGNKESYTRTNDVTSALVFNHSLTADTETEYYFVVWLSETGTNQTPGKTVGDVTNPAAANFFAGNVTFTSAQGSEVSATFTGYTRVESDQVNQNENDGE